MEAKVLTTCESKRMRESIRERRILIRIALIWSILCLVFCQRMQSCDGKIGSLGSAADDLIEFDRNRNLEPQQSRYREGRIISKGERHGSRSVHISFVATSLQAALLFDAQVYSSARLTLAFLLSAASAGADLANYAQVTSSL